jgi:hypothetical protein
MTDEIKLADLDDANSPRQAMRRWKQHPAIRFANVSFDAVRDAAPSALRLATSAFRHLPTAVIVGAKRAGTRKLYTNLLKHPRCYGAVEKEIDYFSAHADRSVAWYRSRFPLRRRVLRREGHVIEVSPSYLPTPIALRQMRQVLPKARVIVLLSDPVARAFAHYQHDKVRYVESRSFADCIAEEIRIGGIPPEFGAALRPDAAPMLGYVARGYYGLQLELLLKVYPRNKVLLIDSASLHQNPAAVCERVFDFLGLDSFDVQPTKTNNRDSDQPIVDPRVAAELREHYRPHDELLIELIGQQFSWMPSLAKAAA